MRYLWQAAEATREGAEKLKGFGLAEGSSTPHFGRIMVVFLLLAALAWAAAWLLRRFSSRWGARFGLAGIGGAGASPIRHVARSSLPGGIACHLVEAQGSRVLITVSRHGVTSLLLGAATPPPESAP
jgi:hypothetical protein